ncbi:PadR family transcriptional regulator [Streptomyces pseudovenezuelae]|uniref:PadR family transcriptional regulator n=1 Tax=Streptomyces pseudovenezuelae TaxID=67350 RepID=UPI0036E78239
MNSVPLRDRAGFGARFVESMIAASVVTFAAVAVATSAVAVSTPRAITRRTKPTTKVLTLLLNRHLEDSESESWGYDIATATGLGVASVYPILRRLERAGWLLSRDEDPGEARNDKVRPSRTYFRINPEHLGEIRQEMAVHDARQRSTQSSAPGGARSRAIGAG